MSLDPQVQAYLARLASLNIPSKYELGPEKVRQQARAGSFALSGEPPAIAKVEDLVVPGPTGQVPVRVYTPAGSGPFPALLYSHGGGWVNCDLDTHEVICRSLANGAGCIVVSVDYRQSPEYKFPSGLEDCYAVLTWLAASAAELNVDPARLAVGGDSSGGNFAAALALMARDRGGPDLALQLLIYPITDLRLETPSMARNGTGYALTEEDMEWYREQYIRDEADIENPLVSPGLAADLTGLPSAFILTAEFDPLVDEAEIYGERLAEAGVPVKVSCYDGQIHGFVRMTAVIDRSYVALAECSQVLKLSFK
ncbi:MAG: alpha/beta hydrolase [Chloroflexi bacterium]|nr:alpha/beta hydrolase [Chloroflexota bacterium]OJV88192.1 MAG: lipase [Chloroflexi bacterium 54-19]